MKHNAKSIRPFIGARDFETSRRFYRDLGFKEDAISYDMSAFHSGELSFYLQDYYIKDWIDNTMVFMEVDDIERFWNELVALELSEKYRNVRLVPIKTYDWGKECFVHDPSGILWHFGEFFSKE
jgi:catechol 2,3-dioxygenase-like lactoylglutathione lyase family enzyme